MRRRSLQLGLCACVSLSIFLNARSLPAAQMSETEIADYRMSERIPENEREMSIDQLVELLGQRNYPWVLSAIRLRCRLAGDEARREIYDKLATVAIQAGKTDDPELRIERGTIVMVLGDERDHRDEALAALKTILARTDDPLTKDACYMNISRLGGAEAIEILREAILAGPPEGTITWSIHAETYQNLITYLGWSGPDAAPVLFELMQKLGAQDDYRWWVALAGTRNKELVMPFLLDKARTSPEFNRSRALNSACLLARGSCTLETRRIIAEMLVQDAESTSSGVREVVAWGLGVVGNATHIPVLERMAQEDPYSAVIACSQGEKRWEEVRYPVREAAAKAIEQIQARMAKEQKPATPYSRHNRPGSILLCPVSSDWLNGGIG